MIALVSNQQHYQAGELTLSLSTSAGNICLSSFTNLSMSSANLECLIFYYNTSQTVKEAFSLPKNTQFSNLFLIYNLNYLLFHIFIENMATCIAGSLHKVLFIYLYSCTHTCIHRYYVHTNTYIHTHTCTHTYRHLFCTLMVLISPSSLTADTYAKTALTSV